MEYNFEVNGQEVSITDSQDILQLSDLFETDTLSIEDLPSEDIQALRTCAELGF